MNEKLEDKAIEIVEALQSGVTEAGPLLIKAIWIDGLITIISGLALAGLTIALWKGTKEYALAIDDEFDDELFRFIGWGLSAVLGLCSILNLFNAHAWIAVFDPKAALALHLARGLAG